MLNIGIIGYGRRIAHMARELRIYGIPYRIAAIADPRMEEIRSQAHDELADTRFFGNAEDMLQSATLDGVMVGTRCNLHTEMACKVAAHRLPLFLEKPVAITFEQLASLSRAFEDYDAPTVVSFPLRLTPIVQQVKQIIDSGEIGTVEQVIACNDVPYGGVYYYRWYRDYRYSGGLFMQKSTHDLDYIAYLLQQRPAMICAMKAQRVYGGDKPFDLYCRDCEEQESCPESPFNLFYERFQGDEVQQVDERMCMFAKGIRNQDMGSCIIEYTNGAQATYTQNFFARHSAARRGARLYGYRGTIHFDWYENAIHVYRHHSPTVETIDFGGSMPHFGGDRELQLDFLRAMRDGASSRSPIAAGIESALTCLWARESAESHRFCRITMPE